MLPKISGRVAWIFDQPNFDIDLIVGVENIGTQDIETLKFVCMADYDPDFAESVQPGDLIVGGENFGYGHPHFPACRALRALGIAGIVAESFSPGFYRGESTNAFPLIECPGILDNVKRWDHLSFDWDSEVLSIKGKAMSLQCARIPQKTKDLLEAGDLISYLQRSNRLRRPDEQAG
ncbi:MAG: hypothetical protein JJT90_06750 [Ectothiorhodospiraceae bacterium]|nr:hypothetical protein [Ectothiorhodospiraceae bacterium]